MSGFITVIRKNGRNTNGRNTNGRNSRNTNGRQTTVVPNSKKTNKFDALNENFPEPKRVSKTWKRASIGQWGKKSSLVVKNGTFVQKKRQQVRVQQEIKDCSYCHEDHDIRDKAGEITCQKLIRKLQYEGNQKKQVQKERKSHRELAQIERTNAWTEQLRQQFAAVEIQPREVDLSDESSDESSDEEYDLSLQCDEEQREEQREKELLDQKRLNRIKEVEADLLEAKADLAEETKSNDSWADAGDVDDLELRIECLEEKLDRLKNK